MSVVNLRDLESRLLGLKDQPAVGDELDVVSKGINIRAEQQRRDIGGGFAAGNILRKASKEFIKALKQGDLSRVDQFQEIFVDAWDTLRSLDLPADKGWQQDGEAGGELVEAEAVLALHTLLFDARAFSKDEVVKETRKVLNKLWYRLGDPKTDQNLEELVSTEETMPMQDRVHIFTTSYQTWLAGIGDAPGELGKFLRDILIMMEAAEDGSDYHKRVALIERYLGIVQTIYNVMDEFETCYGGAIDNNRRRGYFNTYRGLLGRIARLLEIYNAELMTMANRRSSDQLARHEFIKAALGVGLNKLG